MAPAPAQAQRIRRIAESLITLPALPTVVARFLDLIDQPRTRNETLAILIEQDQVLTARLLKLANSSFYAFPRQIGSVKLALIVLGSDAVKELALSLSALHAFHAESAHPRFDLAHFWQHSLAVGCASRLLAAQIGTTPPSEAFVAGLLHDLGKLVLNQYLASEFHQIQEDIARTGCNTETAERRIIGVTHGTVGAWLAEHWNLPSALCGALREHGEPWEAEPVESLPLLVHLANWMAHHLRLGEAPSPEGETLSPSALDLMQSRLKLTLGDLEALLPQLRSEYDRSSDFLQV